MTFRTSSYAPSPNVAALKESVTIAVSQRAKALRAAGREIIDLGAGELEFETPAPIRRAAEDAIEHGATRYTATEGILPLREAIAARANAIYKGEDRVVATDVVVGTGSKQALFNACFVLFGDGDEVLIPTPAWTSYYEMVSLARARAVAVQGREEHRLTISADQLAAASSERTRGVMLNSPCNPTGAVYGRAQLSEILELANERGWWVISDEIYRRIAYGIEAPSCFDVARTRERLVVVDGVAKGFAMTGWRIGWAVAPPTVSRAIGALQSHTTSNAAAPSQHAALAALTLGDRIQPALDDMLVQLTARRAACLELLRAVPSVRFIEPDGAFYFFIHVGDGDAFAARLLDAHGVAVVPGSAFLTPEWIRISFAAPLANVTEGLRRIISLL